MQLMACRPLLTVLPCKQTLSTPVRAPERARRARNAQGTVLAREQSRRTAPRGGGLGGGGGARRVGGGMGGADGGARVGGAPQRVQRAPAPRLASVSYV